MRYPIQYRVMLALVLLGVWIQSPAWAQSIDPWDMKTELLKPRIWTTETLQNLMTMTKDCAGTDDKSDDVKKDCASTTTDIRPFLPNPSYSFYPYLSFVGAADGKSTSVYSDGGVRATLMPVAGTAGEYDIVGTIAHPAAGVGSKPAAARLLGRITVTDARCQYWYKQTKSCFVFRQIAPDLSASFGGLVREGDRWFDWTNSKTPQPPQDQQSYGNIFVSLANNFQFVRKCYDMVRIDLQDLQNVQCTSPIFADLDPNSRNYQKLQIGEKDVGVPWGWYYIPNNRGYGETKSRSLDTATDIGKAMSLSVGVNASVSLFGAEASSKVNVGVKARLDQSRENKTSTLTRDYMWTDYAFVLNRTFATLSSAFDADIRSLAIDKDYDGFIDQWGTHYPYAVTFGNRSHHSLTSKEEQTASMSEQGLNVDVGMQVGYKMMGQGGSAGFDVKTNLEQNNKIKNIVGESNDVIICYGGSGCDGGHVSGSSVIPVQLDLRPISELLGPPFFTSPEDQDIFTRVRDELGQAIALRSFLSAEQAQQLNASGPSRYIVMGVNMVASDTGMKARDISKDGPKLSLRVFTTQEVPMTQLGRPGIVTFESPTSPAMPPRPSSNTNGVWIIPFSTIEPAVARGDRVLPDIQAKPGTGFTCSGGQQLPDGTILIPLGINGTGVGQSNSGSLTYKMAYKTPTAEYAVACPNITTTFSWQIVNSGDLLTVTGPLTPRDGN
jgi:MAC/Perforin domain